MRLAALMGVGQVVSSLSRIVPPNEAKISVVAANDQGAKNLKGQADLGIGYPLTLMPPGNFGAV